MYQGSLDSELNKLWTKDLAYSVVGSPTQSHAFPGFHLLKLLDHSHLELIYKQWNLHTFDDEGINNPKS